MDGLKCIICGAPATTIKQGHDYCSDPACLARGPAAPALALAAAAEPLCVVCSEMADRVMQGRAYCAQHGPGDLTPEIIQRIAA